jgi:hypothetical protein
VRHVEAEYVQLHPHAADHANTLAKIYLRMARRMTEWHEGLATARPGKTHMVLDHCVAASEPVLIA